MVWGKSSAGVAMTQCSRPSLIRQARDLALARVNKTEFGRAVLVPEGWTLLNRDIQVVLELPPSATPVSAGCTDSCLGRCYRALLEQQPLQFTIVLKLPFYFSGSVSSDEANHEWDVELIWAKGPNVSGVSILIHLNLLI